MSDGLLQRLAERALGLAQPLRSQRAAPSLGTLPALPVQADPALVMPSAAADREVDTPRVAQAVRSADAVPAATKTQHVPAPQVPAPTRAVAPPLLPRHTTQAVSAQPVSDKPSDDFVMAPAALPAMAFVLPLAAPPQAMDRPLAHADPRPVDSTWLAPLPLLPEQPPQAASLRSPLDSRAPALHERSTMRTASSERPTEVHVSIGRVELTALAPPPNAARPARTREPSRSLSDYLRPAGKGKS